MFLAPLVLFCVTHFSDKKVSVVLPAAPCSRLLPDLGKAVGVSLEADASVKDDVVFVSVKDVAADELMKRLAETLNAEWKSEGGVQRLFRSSERNAAEDEREYVDHAELCQKFFTRIRDEVEKRPPYSDDVAEKPFRTILKAVEESKTSSDSEMSKSLQKEVSSMKKSLPGYRALQDFVLTLKPLDLVKLKGQKRYVYSTSPTAAQIALNPDQTAVAKHFIKDESTFRKTYTRMSQESPVLKGFGATFPEVDLQAWETSPPKVSFSVVRFGSLLTFRVALFQPNGDTADSMSFDFDWVTGEFRGDDDSADGGGSKTGGDTNKVKDPPSVKEEKLKLSDEWKFLSPDGWVKPPSSVAEKLMDPVKYEPLSLLVSPLLEQVASIRKLNVVAYLPDDAAYVMPMDEGGQMYGPTEYLQQFDSIDVSEKGNWLIIQPDQPWSARDERIDRAALKEYLAKVQTGMPLSVDDTVAFTKKFENSWGTLLQQQKLHLTGYAAPRWSETEDWALVYGAMTEEQRTKALSKEGFRLSEGSEDLKNRLNELLYLDTTHLHKLSKDDLQPVVNMPFFSQDYLKRLPSEVVPNGVTSDSVLRLYKNSFDVVFTCRGDDITQTDLVGDDGWEVASEIHAVSNGGKEEKTDSDDPRKSKFVVGTREVIYFVVRYGDKAEQWGTLVTYHIDGKSAVPYSGLPADFRQRVDRELARLNKSGAADDDGSSE